MPHCTESAQNDTQTSEDEADADARVDGSKYVALMVVLPLSLKYVALMVILPLFFEYVALMVVLRLFLESMALTVVLPLFRQVRGTDGGPAAVLRVRGADGGPSAVPHLLWRLVCRLRCLQDLPQLQLPGNTGPRCDAIYAM